MKIQLLLILLVVSVFLNSCSSSRDCQWPPACCKKVVKQLPYGNADRALSEKESINTDSDDIAPVQLPFKDSDYENIWVREFNANYGPVMPSSRFAKENLVRRIDGFELNEKAVDDLTKNIESISFIDDASGFAAFSHPPTKFFAEKALLNLDGISGGTDIFEFSINDEKNITRLINIKDINTEFWDSHPFAYKTLHEGKTVTVLLFASDRSNPYIKKQYIDGSVVSKGESDLFYSMKIDGIWTPAKKLDVSIDGVSEITPFIYCICENPLLIFSSNRNDKTPDFIEDERKEDFDIDSVRIEIDITNRIIKKIGDIGSMKKGKEDFFSFSDSIKIDSTINTYSDERFPYVAYPYNNKGDNYIYFSSNRNPKPTPIFGTKDTVIQSKGGELGYDIYRFPLEVECLQQHQKLSEIQLIVHLIDIDTKKHIEGDALVVLHNTIDNIKDSSKIINPTAFKINKDSYYNVNALSSFKSIDTSCSGITRYYMPANKQKFSESFQLVITDTIKKRLHLSEIAAYFGEGVSISYTDSSFYYNYTKYIANINETLTYLWQDPDRQSREFASTILLRKRIIDVDNHIKILSVTSNYNLSDNSYNTLNNSILPSERTNNNGIFTYDINDKIVTIQDTIYFKMQRDTSHCIHLKVNIVDRLNPNEKVLGNKKFRLFELNVNNEEVLLNDSSYILENTEEYVVYRLRHGSKYLVRGGTDYLLLEPCNKNAPRRQIEYYFSDFADFIYNKHIRASEDNEVSNISYKYGEIDASKYKPSETAYDTIYLNAEYFEKPLCRYEFTEIQTDYHRRVPYFQTAFWEVNTSQNLKRDLNVLNRNNSLYNRPFPPQSVDLPEPPETWAPWWHGAKWIELHKNNTYWVSSGDNSASSRNNRINQYRNFAKTVDDNIKQMQEIIGNELLPVYELISKADTCSDCGDRKFIIEIEAWSDYRPVSRGWYLSKSDDENTISYAECEDIATYHSSGKSEDFFRSVKVQNGDPLGENNRNLSILRAFFGFKEILNYLRLNNNFNKYSEDEILTPDRLVDNDGNLLKMNEIDSLINKSKIIILARGYDTDIGSGVSANQPFHTSASSPVDVAKYTKMKNLSTFYNLDTVRTLYVVVRHLKYYQGRMITDSCCVDNQMK